MCFHLSPLWVRVFLALWSFRGSLVSCVVVIIGVCFWFRPYCSRGTFGRLLLLVAAVLGCVNPFAAIVLITDGRPYLTKKRAAGVSVSESMSRELKIRENANPENDELDPGVLGIRLPDRTNPCEMSGSVGDIAKMDSEIN